MKLNNNGKLENIIGTDDIFISSNNSSIGKTLKSVLDKQDLDILDLKRNVKWLYKYGGVGGGGGTSISSTKISCVISYTNTNGLLEQSKIEEGSIFNIKEGTSITVTCTITSNKSLNEYVFNLNNLKTTIKATDINGSITTVPDSNTVYTLTVVGESTVSLLFSVFTKIMQIGHLIVLKNGSSIQSNSSIYNSQITGANYEFTIVNNLPNYFNYSIDRILVNSVEVTNFNKTETTNSINNSKTLKAAFSLTDYFTEYNIYLILVDYTFGSDNLSIIDSFIYQSDEAFLYCWSDMVDVYRKETSNPNASKLYNNVVNFRIYPGKDDSITLQYNITINSNDNSNTKTVSSGTIYTYTITNDVKDDNVHLIQIEFNLYDNTFTYYIYLKKSSDVLYFFTDDNGNNFYQAIYCDTEDLNQDIMKFPEKNPTITGNPIIINTQQEYTLKTTSNSFGTIENDDYVSNFIQSSPQEVGNLRLDALFSFGIKYQGSNWELPMIGIKYSETGSSKLLQLYKNKLVFNNDEYDICIPDDGNFHLILLYFKSDYKISNDKSYINTDNTKLVVVLYIDGVQETKPFEITNFFILKNYTSIVYYPGLWHFNHIGVATFNGKPIEYSDKTTRQDSVAKYLLDFDPIIPSNYYQSYRTKILSDTPVGIFGKEIYTTLCKHSSSSNDGPLWINYFNYNNDTNSHLNKFINVDPATLISLAPLDMEAYCIIPESTYLGLDESGFDTPIDNHLNLFVYNTFKSYGENDKISKVNCDVKKWVNGQWVSLIDNKGVQDEIVLFYIKYQGSSTLLYGAKNFEIGAEEILQQDDSLPVYFTPDVNKFPYMESSFNLKADVVDSSHSNNVIIGNFVNDYMTSPFNTTKKTYNSCLTGKPILLFILNNAQYKGETIDDSYIYLGIYSLNLSRKSVHNLGYSKLEDSNGLEIITPDDSTTQDRCCDNITKFHVLQTTEKESLNGLFAVGEVLDNGVLFDYSQFDSSLLANKILGDFYVADGDRISTEYSTIFIKPFKVLSEIIYNYFISTGIYNTVNLLNSLKKPKDLTNPELYYYTDGDSIKLIPSNAYTVSAYTLNNLPEGFPYHTYENYNGKKIGLINNPLQQFHLVCNESGLPITIKSDNFYYIEELTNLIYNLETENTKIDVKSLVQYFIVCMAFAMVDSVQKNLTIKCPDTKTSNTWFTAFYDMDTAFGLTNSSGKTSFQAFSDYVDDDGTIIQNYSPLHASGLFDTPSSFLFIYAKYIDIVTNNAMSATDGIYPFLEWSKLRSINGAFESGTKFCEKYVDNYFGDINPLLWNLNYAYKYFSETQNTSSTDTESSRFNGTRRFARKEYLNLRFLYLDVLFGFKNEESIGRSESLTITKNGSIPSNEDIKINNTMFPNYSKGCIGNIDVIVKDLPKTPLVLQISTNLSKLFITDDTGKAHIQGSITTDTDTGFYGSTELTSVSECGQFLIKSSSNNTITNNRITDIVITKSNNNNANLLLDLTNMLSVNNITIGSSSVLNYNTITIKGSTSTTYNLNNIIIKNIKCNSIILLNFNVDTLNITSCTSTSFTIQNIKANSFTHSSNRFNSESWSGFTLNKSLTITNSVCTQLNISTSTIKALQYMPSYNCSTLYLDLFNTEEFIFGNTPYIKTVTVKSSNINKFILNYNYNGFANTEITLLDLQFTNTSLNLSIPGFSKLETLLLGKVTSCSLLNNAFNNCTKLKSLPSKTLFTIAGNYVFKSANSLDKSDMLRCNLTNTNYLGLFRYNSQIDNDFVINWFNSKTANSLHTLFFNCPNINLLFNISSQQPSDKFKLFETAFVKAINKTTNIDKSIIGTFYYSNVNTFTKDIADALIAKGVTTYNCVIGYNTETEAINKILFIEELALNKFTYVKLGGLNIDSYWYYPQVCVFNSLGIITESKISDYFDSNSKIKLLFNFTPVTGNTNNIEISIDFKDGFPSTLKELGLFERAYNNPINVINLEYAFNNLTGCSLINSSFSNPSLSSTYSKTVNLFEMLFKESNNNLVPKINTNFTATSSDGPYFTFNKLLTYELFSKMINYYSGKIDNLSWVFRCATITNCTDSNILDYKLSSFNNFVGTFANAKFNNVNDEEIAVDISNAFSTKGSSQYKEVKSLEQAFLNCNLIKFTKRLPIMNVENMQNTFNNCSFTNNQELTDPIQTWLLSTILNIQVYSDKAYLLLPDNFFNICKSGCILKGCFSCDSFSTSHLTGYLPNTDTLGILSLINKSCDITKIFNNCNITYYPLSNRNYRIFPSWYTKLSFTNRFSMYTALPLRDNNSTLYLFEDSNSIIGLYDQLPNVPDRSIGNTAYFYSLLTGDVVSNYGILKVSPNSDTFPSVTTSATYKNMIPYRLSLILRMGELTQVITNMENLISNGTITALKDLPLIYDIESGSEAVSHIFNGDTIDNDVKYIVIKS